MILIKLANKFDGKHDWMMNLTSEELDELLGGLYFMDKEGKSTELSDKMIVEIEKSIEMQRHKRVMSPPFNTDLLPDHAPFTSIPFPKVHLTSTQRAEVQLMIESYVLQLEKDRKRISDRFRAKAKSDMPFGTVHEDDDNTKY